MFPVLSALLIMKIEDTLISNAGPKLVHNLELCLTFRQLIETLRVF